MNRKRIYTKQLSEANVKAEIYYQLKRRGITSQLECYFYLHGFGGHRGKTHIPQIRADLVVTDEEGYAIAAIEVKKIDLVNDWYERNQRKKYEHLGLPFYYCCGMKEIPQTIKWVRQICQKGLDK